MSEKLKKIFITGGAGYVGAMLAPYLANRGYKVIVFDLMIYGGDVIDPHKNISLVKGDIRDIELLEKHLLRCNLLFLDHLVQIPKEHQIF